MRPSWHQWVLLVVTTLGLAALLSMAQVIVAHSGWRLDLTPEKLFTLSPHARRVLAELSRDVQITAFTRAADERNRDISDLFERLRAASPRVHTAIVDINRNPAVARYYGVGNYAGIVVECNGRRRDFASPSEPLLIAALLQVTRDTRRVVYFLSGHGEPSIENTDPRRGYSAARVALTQELYDVRPLDLLHHDDVPADADVVVIAAAQHDPLPVEMARLTAYVERGGGLLILLEPRGAPAIDAMLALYGVHTDEALVADADTRLFAGDYMTVSVTGMSKRHPVTLGLETPPLFSGARPLALVAPPRATIRSIELLSTAASSWRTTDFDGWRTGQVTFVAGRDVRGPQSVGVSLMVSAAAAASDTPARFIVLGDSDFANNFFLDYLGNKDLLVNAVNWLAGEQALLAARPQSRVAGVNQFFLTDEQGYTAFMLGTVVEPGIVLLVGLAFYMRRRWRG
jgi:ABC-type uncharacterized transport system involved in gliding motility auxiliary subunit